MKGSWMSDSDFLREISELTECRVESIEDVDHVARLVPKWAEIALYLRRDDHDGHEEKIYLRRSDGELIIECLRETLHPHGAGVLEALWEELDEAFSTLKEAGGKKADPESAGLCRGLSLAIARIVNPYAPDVDEVRRQVVDRYQSA